MQAASVACAAAQPGLFGRSVYISYECLSVWLCASMNQKGVAASMCHTQTLCGRKVQQYCAVIIRTVTMPGYKMLLYKTETSQILMTVHHGADVERATSHAKVV